MIGSLTPGDVLVADRYYPSFFTLALLQEQGVDMVSMSHVGRTPDFTLGQSLGTDDHIVVYEKPLRPKWMDVETYRAMPDEILVREFAVEKRCEDGSVKTAVVVSTMTDPTIPQKELSDLYWATVEL
jgi:hypothetical protein